MISISIGGAWPPQDQDFIKAHSVDSFMADRPKAGRLLRAHPDLEQWFRNEWSRGATFPIVWDNQQPTNSPVAENGSTSNSHFTALRVNKNLSPVDQLLALCYETCNAEGRPRINQLAAQAAYQKITRQEFTLGIEKAEFKANLRTKEIFPKLLPLSPNQVEHDDMYRGILEMPSTFEEYQAWNLRNRNAYYLQAEALYEREYSDLIKQGRERMQNTNTVHAPPAFMLK